MFVVYKIKNVVPKISPQYQYRATGVPRVRLTDNLPMVVLEVYVVKIICRADSNWWSLVGVRDQCRLALWLVNQSLSERSKIFLAN